MNKRRLGHVGISSLDNLITKYYEHSCLDSLILRHLNKIVRLMYWSLTFSDSYNSLMSYVSPLKIWMKAKLLPLKTLIECF